MLSSTSKCGLQVISVGARPRNDLIMVINGAEHQDEKNTIDKQCLL